MRCKILLLFMLLLSAFADAQVVNLSPYSRFGIGDIYQAGNVGTIGLGGVRSTFNDRFQVNAENPATLGYLNNTIFQTALRLQNIRLSKGDSQQDLSGGNMDQFILGLKRSGSKMGFVFGVTPFSTSGYDIQTNEEIEDIGSATYSYEGSGGINRMFLGAGRRFEATDYYRFNDKNGDAYDSIKVVKHTLSIGANLDYYFGSVAQTRRLDLSDVTFLDTRRRTVTRLFDFSADLGVHYQTTLRSKYGSDKRLRSQWLLQLAAVYSPQADLNTRYEETAESTTTSSEVVFPVDTTYAVNAEGSTRLPARLRYGAAVHFFNSNGRHFALMADIAQQDWSSYQIDLGDEVINPNLVESSEFSLGFQYTPKSVEEGSNVFNRTQYRFGARQTNTYLELEGTQIVDEAFTAGFSTPLLSSRSTSKLHFGMEFGRRGVDEGKLIQEDYLNIFIGVTLSPFYKNVWFKERKYE